MFILCCSSFYANRPVTQIPQCTSHIPTMHHFVPKMCLCVHISATKWRIVWHLSYALWGFIDGHSVNHICWLYRKLVYMKDANIYAISNVFHKECLVSELKSSRILKFETSYSSCKIYRLHAYCIGAVLSELCNSPKSKCYHAHATPL